MSITSNPYDILLLLFGIAAAILALIALYIFIRNPIEVFLGILGQITSSTRRNISGLLDLSKDISRIRLTKRKPKKHKKG